jgi:hypothetical protein
MSWKWKLFWTVVVLVVLAKLAEFYFPSEQQVSDPYGGMSREAWQSRERAIERSKALKPLRDACLKGATQRRIDECLDAVDRL